MGLVSTQHVESSQTCVLCLLHWQMDSQSLDPRKVPLEESFKVGIELARVIRERRGICAEGTSELC